MLLSLVRRLGPLALLLLLVAPASAQIVPLDGQWFRLQVHAKGRTVKPDLTLKKASLKTKCFLQLSQPVSTPTGFTYTWQLWTKQDGNIWAPSGTGTHTFVGSGSGDQVAVDLPLDLVLANGKSLSVRATLLFNLKVKKKNGQLKKCRVVTLGGETVDGSANGTDTFVGGAVIKGHDIKPGKLPFDPP
jgi:hypothetical protein